MSSVHQLAAVGLVGLHLFLCAAGASCSSADPRDTSLPDADASTADGGAPHTTASNGEPSDGGALTAGAPTSPSVEEGSPAVRFVGRFDRRDGAGPVASWPGARILARFEGTSVSVTLEEIAPEWMEGAPSEWDVAIDRVWQPKLVTTRGVHAYPLAVDLPHGPHEVELYKRSEAQNGYTRFLGFDFGGGKLLPPPPPSMRRIEIIGDSTPAAFGVEGVGFPDNVCPGVKHAAKWQNFHKSFGALLGSTLDAEVHGTVYSGKGIVKNIWRPDRETLPVVFLRANPLDPSSSWDFSWTPDVVVVMAGGNDFALGLPDENAGGPPSPDEFTSGYRAFVDTLRANYPDAHLVLSVSPSVKDTDPAGRHARTHISLTTSTIASERRAAGDARVHAFSPGVASPSELTGCDSHGNPELHLRLANEYATFVRRELGW